MPQPPEFHTLKTGRSHEGGATRPTKEQVEHREGISTIAYVCVPGQQPYSSAMYLIRQMVRSGELDPQHVRSELVHQGMLRLEQLQKVPR